MPPWPQSLQSDEPAQHHQICIQTSTQAGKQGGDNVEMIFKKQCTRPQKSKYNPVSSRYVHAKHERTGWYRSPPFSSPNICCCVMLPLTQRIQASSAETGSDREEGCVAEAV
ncbi:hypothetical protein PBY51_012016 [Eleginops maclovinus]|uniref:Uncharacterized protein n=1 Tax=Eleginops maclovinus TaxID=56733 RepID=A0AAN7XVC8_ELEMC|nr:hypothetical protein PBY51_012016 [Eleginops maclovinus]